MADSLAIFSAQAAATAARPIMSLSRTPTVVNNGAYVTIELDAQLQDEVAAFILRQLAGTPSTEPGAPGAGGGIHVDGLGGVLLKVLVRKYGLWAGGALGGAFGLGWLTGGKKR